MTGIWEPADGEVGHLELNVERYPRGIFRRGKSVQGDSDRHVARSQLIGWAKVAAFAHSPPPRGWLAPDATLPNDVPIGASVHQALGRAAQSPSSSRIERSWSARPGGAPAGSPSTARSAATPYRIPFLPSASPGGGSPLSLLHPFVISAPILPWTCRTSSADTIAYRISSPTHG